MFVWTRIPPRLLKAAVYGTQNALAADKGSAARYQSPAVAIFAAHDDDTNPNDIGNPIGARMVSVITLTRAEEQKAFVAMLEKAKGFRDVSGGVITRHKHAVESVAEWLPDVPAKATKTRKTETSEGFGSL